MFVINTKNSIKKSVNKMKQQPMGMTIYIATWLLVVKEVKIVMNVDLIAPTWKQRKETKVFT